MNLLYIGPYRQYDYMGQLSRISLHCIKEKLSYKNHKVYSRPVYVDQGSVDNKIPKYLSDDEFFPSEEIKWDAIIQHLPMEFLTSQQFTQNIAIPILNNQLSRTSLYNENFKTLNHFDHILVDSDNQKNFLLKSGISTKINVYNEEIKSDYLDNSFKNKQFDLGVLDNGFVFSFIGSYDANIQIIQKLIVSFLTAFRGEPDKVLFLLLKGTSKDREKLQQFYDNTKQQLNIINSDPILFSFGSLGLPEAVAALNTSFCYLSINNDISHTMYEKYMLSLSKMVISKYSLDITQTPVLGMNKFYDIEDIVGSINTMSLIQKLKSSITENKNSKNKFNNKSLGETLCDILQ